MNKQEKYFIKHIIAWVVVTLVVLIAELVMVFVADIIGG